MLIPTSYLMKDDNAPDGTVVRTCKFCQRKFAVPEERNAEYKPDACEDCSADLDKEIAAASAALMKNPTDAADTIKTALGK